MPSKSIHVAANGIISFFFMAEYYSSVYMYHIFFIHSSIDEHLGSFYVLAIINCAAVSIGVHMYLFKLEFSLDICPGLGLLDHMVTLWESVLCNLFLDGDLIPDDKRSERKQDWSFSDLRGPHRVHQCHQHSHLTRSSKDRRQLLESTASAPHHNKTLYPWLDTNLIFQCVCISIVFLPTHTHENSALFFPILIQFCCFHCTHFTFLT